MLFIIHNNLKKFTLLIGCIGSFDCLFRYFQFYIKNNEYKKLLL